MTRVCEAALNHRMILDKISSGFLIFENILTAGLKLNSMTSPTKEVRLFGEYIRGEAPLTPTMTLVLRSPPIGSPFVGEVLVEAVFAFVANASIVFPFAGLDF